MSAHATEGPPIHVATVGLRWTDGAMSRSQIDCCNMLPQMRRQFKAMNGLFVSQIHGDGGTTTGICIVGRSQFLMCQQIIWARRILPNHPESFLIPRKSSIWRTTGGQV